MTFLLYLKEIIDYDKDKKGIIYKKKTNYIFGINIYFMYIILLFFKLGFFIEICINTFINTAFINFYICLNIFYIKFILMILKT